MPTTKIRFKTKIFVKGDKLLELWETSDRFRIKFLEELLKDSLHEQINSICSGNLYLAIIADVSLKSAC